MDTLTSILKLVNQNSWTTSVDLKQTYYSCPVSKSHQKYIKFIWNGYVYKFVCFPNGLACCPRKFTELLKPVFARLRKMGYTAAGYIDDTFLQGDSFDDCYQNERIMFVNIYQRNSIKNSHSSSITGKYDC